jgi:integrating conjugative element protein (TIGR03758 family)
MRAECVALSSAALSALQTASGVAPDKVSLTIRAVLLVIIFIWAAWCVLGEVDHAYHHALDEYHVLRKTSRILFIVSVMVVLVFIA